MLDSILERRIRQRDGYDLYLDIPEKEFYRIYEDLNKKSADDILNNFLHYHQDDGRPTDIAIKHNKNRRIITINAVLNYLDNDHTKEKNLPNYIKQ